MDGVLHLIVDDLERIQHACADDLAEDLQAFLAPYAAFADWDQAQP